MKWSELKYWKCGEWDVVREKLKEEKKYGICPDRKNLFKALKEVPFRNVRVLIMGQDPYPDPRNSTGVAFSIPKGKTPFPPTLCNIFTELVADCMVSYPDDGDLTRWCQQGVLLWNAYPSCRVGQAGSHHWDEWTYLTKEIVEKLDGQGIIFCLLGASARGYSRYCIQSPVIETSHPSPLGANKGFLGSRIFSRINSHLDKPIDWSLHEEEREDQTSTSMRKKVIRNPDTTDQVGTTVKGY